MNTRVCLLTLVFVVLGNFCVIERVSSLTPAFPFPGHWSNDITVNAVNDPHSVAIGESTTVEVEFSGEDIKPCSVYIADVDHQTYGYGDVLDCDNDTDLTTDDTITATVTALDGASADGLNVTLDYVFGIIGAEPPEYGTYYGSYYASFTLEGVTEGDYEVRFTVYPKIGRFGKSNTISVQVSAGLDAYDPDFEMHEVVADLDGDGSFTPEDCDDTDVTVYPGATELCDGVDNNCVDGVDEDLPVSPFYLDADGDGYGTSRVSLSVCPQPSTYVTNADDCNDSSALVNPGLAEICSDGIDNNCDGNIDDGSCAVSGTDADADGYTVDVDCDDANASINPGASDDCTNQIDMNCDNTVSGCAASPQIDTTIPVVQDADVYGEVSGGADVSSGCGCVVTGGVNHYQLSTFMILALSLLGGGMFRFFRER